MLRTSGQALLRTYGRFFAEFLNEESLVPLGLLALSTCVGLRYDAHILNLEDFLGRLFNCISKVKTLPYLDVRNSPLKAVSWIYLRYIPERQRRQTIKARNFISSVPPSHKYARAGILTGYPLAAAFAIALGSPNPWMIAIATETLDFWGLDFSSNLGLLIPTFALSNTPAALTGPPSAQFEMLSYHLSRLARENPNI